MAAACPLNSMSLAAVFLAGVRVADRGRVGTGPSGLIAICFAVANGRTVLGLCPPYSGLRLNTEQIVRVIEIGQIQSFAEFAIFHTGFEPKRAKSAWIDLIINQPADRRFLLEEVVILRRARL